MVQPPEAQHPDPSGRRHIRTAGQARDVTRGFLSSVGPSDSAEAEAVVLVVSELVTKAERHAGGVTGFRLDAAAGSVTVTVSDASTTPPRLRRTDAFEPGGFGWPLVQELARRVSVNIHPHGKSVRAVLPLAH
ncbi:ATP-binding protein [Streptomyces sp. CB03238]|uniref:ATP-binding protein n=1 Tax=Streptomyces sp. CB03238 TaxID=1907777 RepID=UPI000A104854|nr:ATP-binding protein [Streptomyces sp. CB03238]ORT54730.1 hypothetical protein BKD26_34295 [Streptomyces sp. CB03238]